MSNVSTNTSCREWFKRWNILTVYCVYIVETICYVKGNLKQFNQNSNNHNYDTRQRKNLYVTYCRTEACKNSVNNIGKRLYNKLPNNLKSTDNTLHFRKKFKLFLLHQTFYSVENFYVQKRVIYREGKSIYSGCIKLPYGIGKCTPTSFVYKIQRANKRSK
jgi:hypothetical protein